MDYPSGLGRNPVQNLQILALNVYVLRHHTQPRASFHLKTRREYFVYDREFGGTWFFILFGTPFADFSREMGNGVPGQLLLCFALFFLQ
jgi:hypothetical protein